MINTTLSDVHFGLCFTPAWRQFLTWGFCWSCLFQGPVCVTPSQVTKNDSLLILTLLRKMLFSYFIYVKWSRYRPGLAQRVGRGIALLFHYCGTRRGWVVSNTSRPHFTPRKDPVPIIQEAGWAPGPVWTGGKSRPHRDSIPDRPVRSQSLYPLS